MWEYKIYELPYELERMRNRTQCNGFGGMGGRGSRASGWVSSGNTSRQTWASPTVWIILKRVQRNR
jgi:hypothetical protein